MKLDKWADKAVQNGLAILDLERISDTVFIGKSLPMFGNRVFGGQVLAQALVAAGNTMPESRPVHSLHGFFLRPGDPTVPIRFEVEVLRDGRSFSTRRTQAFQNDTPIWSMITSYQEVQAGPTHSVSMPNVPGPEETTSGVELLAQFAGHPTADFWLNQGPFDVRHVEGSLFLQPDPVRQPTQHTWVRTRQPISVSPQWHQALLAFASDQIMLEPALRRHGASWSTPNFAYASLDHAMWWHRPARVDEWLLFVQDSPTAQNGRGLTGAWVFSESGELVASIAQEGMLRMPGVQ